MTHVVRGLLCIPFWCMGCYIGATHTTNHTRTYTMNTTNLAPARIPVESVICPTCHRTALQAVFSGATGECTRCDTYRRRLGEAYEPNDPLPGLTAPKTCTSNLCPCGAFKTPHATQCQSCYREAHATRLERPDFATDPETRQHRQAVRYFLRQHGFSGESIPERPSEVAA